MPLTGNYKAFTYSIKGLSHEVKQMPNQDAAAYFEHLSLLAVADGHGGAAHPLSQIGSALAVAATAEVLLEYRDMMTELIGVKERLCFLENEFAFGLEQAWKTKVRQEYECNLDKYKLYESHSLYSLFGTTLIMTFEMDGVLYFLQIGDGVAVVYEKEKVVFPILEDPRLFANMTTSLCEPSAWLSMRAGAYVLNDDTQLVALVTDGVENAYPSGELNALDFFEELLVESTKAEIPEAISQVLKKASKFSRDDTTGAFLYNHPLAAIDDCAVIERLKCEEGDIWLSGALQTYGYHEKLAWLRKNLMQNENNQPLFHVKRFKQLVMTKAGHISRVEEDEPMSDLSAFERMASILDAIPPSMVQMSHYPESLNDWRRLLDEKLNEHHLCYVCGTDNNGTLTACASCGSVLPKRVFLVNAYEKHQLFHNSEIYLHHLMPLKGKFDPLIGKVIQHPKHPEVWGIENTSGQTWYLNGNDEEGQKILSGQKLPIKHNSHFHAMGMFVSLWVQ